MDALQREPLARRHRSQVDPLDVVSRLWRNGGRLSRGRFLEKWMNAGFGSDSGPEGPTPRRVERRPTRNLASNKLVGRDSLRARFLPVGLPGRRVGSTNRSAVEPVLAWNFATPDTSEIARRRLLSIRGEPLFHADWDNVTFIHYETD